MDYPKFVVILNGPPGSGKDVAATHLAKQPRFAHREFKQKLIELTCSLFSIAKEDFFAIYTRELKETPSERLRGMSPRQALIFVSETVVKPNFGKMYFGEAASKELIENVVNVFSDGGFFEEAEIISNHVHKDNLFIIRLHREGCDYSQDSRRYLTDEECEKLAYHYTDVHNDSTEPEFYNKIEKEITKWLTS